jgi:hypothetical protein
VAGGTCGRASKVTYERVLIQSAVLGLSALNLRMKNVLELSELQINKVTSGTNPVIEKYRYRHH